MEVRAGQIWKEVYPRQERYIKVLSVFDRRAIIQTVTGDQKRWARKPKTAEREAHLARFDGKRGGYSYVEG